MDDFCCSCMCSVYAETPGCLLLSLRWVEPVQKGRQIYDRSRFSQRFSKSEVKNRSRCVLTLRFQALDVHILCFIIPSPRKTKENAGVSSLRASPGPLSCCVHAMRCRWFLWFWNSSLFQTSWSLRGVEKSNLSAKLQRLHQWLKRAAGEAITQPRCQGEGWATGAPWQCYSH